MDENDLENIKKRKYTRFRPDPTSVSYIDCESDSLSNKFECNLCGLAYSEAYGGCGIMVNATEKLQMGALCKVKVGELGPLIAKVVWRKQLDEDVIKIGLQFLD